MCLRHGCGGAFSSERDQAPTLAEESVAEPWKATELAPARAGVLVERQRLGDASLGLGEHGGRRDPGGPDAAELDGQPEGQLSREVEGVEPPRTVA